MHTENTQTLPQSENQDNKKQSGAHTLLDYVEMFVFTVIAVILLLSFFFRLCAVSGDSMNNTLLDGEHLIVTNLFYTPDTGDIIVFHQTSDLYDQFNEPIVKRVIATSGEFVKIDYTSAKVYVSKDDTFTEEEVLDESQYLYLEFGKWKEHGMPSKVFEVPEGHLFVLGDNRNNSADSRSPQVSFVDERRVLGKVLFRITPFSKFGKVD
ncbi:MAG: signal peptidase I [Ruminococcaceae bacterium]|nr:signal peptidase I [Oscillospiraceae bacterium]